MKNYLCIFLLFPAIAVAEEPPGEVYGYDYLYFAEEPEPNKVYEVTNSIFEHASSELGEGYFDRLCTVYLKEVPGDVATFGIEFETPIHTLIFPPGGKTPLDHVVFERWWLDELECPNLEELTATIGENS